MLSLKTKIFLKDKKQNYRLQDMNDLADIISNAESLFGRNYFKIITRIIILCDVDESLKEIEKYILDNIK